jgi:hypothetical protein
MDAVCVRGGPENGRKPLRDAMGPGEGDQKAIRVDTELGTRLPVMCGEEPLQRAVRDKDRPWRSASDAVDVFAERPSDRDNCTGALIEASFERFGDV